MKAIGNIYLTWRKGKGHARIVVGVIKKNITEGIRFEYKKDLEKAKQEGFSNYTDFPDLNKVYNENVIDIFGQRLTKSERSDIQKYYDFWEISPEYKEDKYYLLAHTQGLLATDNFEFLADYQPIEGLSFISEICGLSDKKLSSDTIEEGDELKWDFEKANEFDEKAIKIFKKDDVLLGYVKIIHNSVFHKPGGKNLKIKVKSIERNGHLNRVFIKISF
jgi:hypothetical protein